MPQHLWASDSILCQCWTALTVKNPSHPNWLDLSLLHLASVGLIPFAMDVYKTLALPLLFSPIRKLKSAIRCPPPWPSLPKTEHKQVSVSWYIILQLPYHLHPFVQSGPSISTSVLWSDQKGPLLILQM